MQFVIPRRQAQIICFRKASQRMIQQIVHADVRVILHGETIQKLHSIGGMADVQQVVGLMTGEGFDLDGALRRARPAVRRSPRLRLVGLHDVRRVVQGEVEQQAPERSEEYRQRRYAAGEEGERDLRRDEQQRYADQHEQNEEQYRVSLARRGVSLF